jgi:solute carrier family 25 (mitochondrial citrate transporter), member 1
MMGGAIEASLLQPLDVLKTRLQLSSSGSVAVVASNMLKQEGITSFYKGLTPFTLHLVTKYSVRWYFNEFYRSLLKDKNGKVSDTMGFVAGLGSGFTEAVLIVTPFEVIKTRLQKQKGSDKSQLKYKGMVHCASTIAKEEGVSALWKGNIPTMLRQGINQLLLFGTYDMMKKAFFGLERDAPISATQV